MATFLLVHGSWHGGWCWRLVAGELQRRGHVVHCPTLAGCAERFHHAPERVDLSTHVRDIVDLLFYEDLQDVVLVAHSYAGMLAQRVSHMAAERLAGVVHLDAYVVPPGRKGCDLWTVERRAEAAAAVAAGNPYRQPMDPAMLGVSDPQMAAFVKARLRPHPLATYDEVVLEPGTAPDVLPKVYLACTQGPLAPVFAPIVEDVGKQGWRVERMAAPHDAMLTHPMVVADALSRAADGFASTPAAPAVS